MHLLRSRGPVAAALFNNLGVWVAEGTLREDSIVFLLVIVYSEVYREVFSTD